jgi:DNA-binding MarR family transcriptional regulator
MNANTRLYDIIKESFLLLDFGDRLLLEKFDLTVPRYYALCHIAAEPGISPSLLSRTMFCDKSNITRLIHGLEIEGLVERRPHETDGRAQRLFLTTAGRELQKRAALAHERFIEQRLSLLVGQEMEGVTRALTCLNRSLGESANESLMVSLN